MKPSATETQQIVTALHYLAGVCDYATRHDGQGFNAYDAPQGHALAMADELDTDELQSAARLVGKYRRQLEDAGLSLPEAAPETARANGVTVNAAGASLIVSFPYDPEKVTRIKSLSERKYDPETKSWRVPPGLLPEIVRLFPTANVTQEAQALADRPAPAVTPPPAPPKPAVNIRRTNGRLVVSFPYDPAKVTKIKNLPERKFDPDRKAWTVPTRLLSDLLKIFPGAQLDAGAQELREQQAQLAQMSSAASSTFDVPGLTGELLPFQRAGVEFVEHAHGRAILAHEMGLGKTIMALAYLQLHPELRPAVIVVPASLKINWQREAEKWLTTGDRFVQLAGTKAYDLAITGGTVFILNYDILAAWLETLIALPPTLAIFDEAHFMKNTKAARSKAGQALAKVAQQVLALTGTPITNRPAELWPLLHLIAPQAWPKFFPFAQEFCDAHQNRFGWDFTGASHLDKLNREIKPYLARCLKAEVLKELPARRNATVVVEFDPACQAEYELTLSEARAAAARTAAEALVFIEKAKQVTVKAKMAAALDWIETFLDTNGKLVVFCTHQQTVDTLMEKFGKLAVQVTGEVTGEARQQAVDRFQSDEMIRLFVGNIKAAGVGLTLTAASDVVFLEYPWTPGDFDQAISRCHRIGQASSVTAWCLVAEHTIDETIAALLQSKAATINRAIDGGTAVLEINLLDEIISRIIAER